MDQAPPPEVRPSPLNLTQEPLTLHNFFSRKNVTVIFPGPRDVMLQLDDGHGTVIFHPGVQELPEELLNHWYLKAHGVKRYEKEKPKELLPATMTQREADFLMSRGYEIPDAAAAQKFYDGIDNNRAREQFLEQAKAWKGQPLSKAAPQVYDAPDLEAMTKEQIVLHAAEVHGLDLDKNDKKDDLIAAVEEARNKKE